MWFLEIRDIMKLFDVISTNKSQEWKIAQNFV